ncbi:thiol-disulfide isomerase/thioredoxin [Pedobacter africanus]|uniref:Thiol-disulfide isomerase/thioredoxin n=1 Tax=Pedobacter africanus TaxID=151894 RepID=A0ACC6KU75_9SPHI|nr:TlpA disulfide reductase family protein [Pedobacter africanus]MDR6782750.1 thiol-disulfide isomerase/thioredoxin [Pedobacter africanus]
MKRYFLTLCFVFGLFSSYAQQGYTVKVKVSNRKNYTPYLAYPTTDSYVVDTAYTVLNGWMLFKGKVSGTALASFGFRRNPATQIETDGGGMIPGPSLNFFLSNESIQIEGDANTVYMAKVTGGKANQEWAVIKAKQNALTHQTWTSLKKAFDTYKPGTDSLVFKQASKIRDVNAAKEEKLQLDFMKNYPNSLVSMYFLANMQNSLSFEALKAAYTKLGAAHKNSSFAKGIAGKISSMEATAIGKKAIPLHKKDINGKDVNLESLKGKYVLLDFWGSWCGPCRSSHPHLKKLYAKYKAEGFEIVGIAQEQSEKLADNLKTWKKAIAEDGIGWIQVLNNDGIKTFDAVRAYGVSAFPTKILLDKEGKIVARYVGDGEEIDAKLRALFGK